MLIGRESECARLDALLDGARSGTSGALVIRGEAGVGKTALLDYARERAEEMTIVSTLGVESEVELDFGGLLDVCRPLLDHVGELPELQAAALGAALGLGPAASFERFAIGAATLGVLAAAAEANPLLVIVDDAQWLDRSSADALLFATRRLEADRAVVLYAARAGEEQPFDAPGVESISLAGLQRKAAASLIRSRVEVAPEVADKLYEATAGNPLALIELPSVLSADQLSGVRALEDPLPPGSSVERAFIRRAEALREDSRRALLLAAASTSSSSEIVLDALPSLGLDARSLEAAEDSRLLRVVDGRIEFRHPLVRSAVYHAAAPSERRAAHRALARACLDAGREESAWHLASAALGPDDEVATSLETLANRARRRNAHAEAAAALERAAGLTPEPAVRSARLGRAAEAAWASGDTERALGLLDAAEAAVRDTVERARLLHLRGMIVRRVGVLSTACDLLLEAEELIRSDDPPEAASILQTAVAVLGRAGELPGALEHARRLRELAAHDGTALDARVEVTLGWIMCLSGNADAARPSLERTVDLLRPWTDEEAGGRAGTQPSGWVELYLASLAFRLLERTADGIELALRASRLARATGPTALLSALDLLTEWEVMTGRWDLAAAHGEEGLVLARQVGHADQVLVILTQLARIDAARGEAVRCRERIDEAARLARDHGIVTTGLAAAGVAGHLELALGRHAEAIEQLHVVAAEVERLGIHDRDNSPHPDLVEALVRAGRHDEAADVLGRYSERAPLGTPLWGAALLARGRAMLAEDDDEAEAHLDEALALHARVEDRFQHARTLLASGERLRRSGRRRDARERLRAAHDRFEALDARPWLERTQRELRASGEVLRRRESFEPEQLTPQELQVVLQVAEGKTNKEVGAALFLSPKTIEFHLARVFRKLGVSSRTELARVVATQGRAALTV